MTSRVKKTELAAITAAQLADDDVFDVVDVSDTSMSSVGTNKKLAKSQLAEAAGVTAHLADASDAHDASAISFAPTGSIAATDVQAALTELDTEKATAAALTAHIDDVADAHDASAISVLDTAGNYTGTDVEAVLAELPGRFGTPPQVQPPVITSYVERFQSGHGWTILGGGASVTDDTDDFVVGSQCATFQTRTDGVARSAEKSGYSASLADSQVAVTFKIADTTNVTEVILFAGDTAFSNYYQWTIHNDGTVEAQRWFKSGEWVTAVLSFAGAAVVGSPSKSTIQRLRFRVGTSNGAAATTVKLNAIGKVAESSAFPNGVVSIAFDDIYASTWTKARLKMSEYGYGGTVYGIADRVGDTYLTAAQLRALEGVGWEIGVHGNSDISAMTPAEAEADVLAEKAAFAALGLRGVNHYAYPQGGFSVEVMQMLRRYFTSARTISYRQTETIRPADAMRLRSYSPSNTTLATALTAAITAAYNNKAWLILTFHDIADTASVSTQYSTANFATVIDHINSTGIPVRTVGDVLSSI